MKPSTHLVIVILGLITPFAIGYILTEPQTGMQLLAGLGVAAVLDRIVHLLAGIEARRRATAGVGIST